MKYLEVGKIIATHAIKGEVKVSLSTSFADERFKKGNVLYVYKDKKYEKRKRSNRRPFRIFA